MYWVPTYVQTTELGIKRDIKITRAILQEE